MYDILLWLMENFKNGDIKKRLLIKTFGLENKRIKFVSFAFKINVCEISFITLSQ